jgi:hypothetical protein
VLRPRIRNSAQPTTGGGRPSGSLNADVGAAKWVYQTALQDEYARDGVIEMIVVDQ